jgi:hypothetical protein
MANIRVFKLISGEELIGEIFNSYETSLELKAPATIMMQQTQTGVGLALIPYMPYSVGNITLSRSAIAAEAKADIKMVNEYNRIFGSGIEIVPASALK